MSIDNRSEISEVNEECFEEVGNYCQELVIDKRKFNEIRNKKLNLTKDKAFKGDNILSLAKNFRRKDIVYYGMNTKELPLKMNECTGRIHLPLLLRNDLENRLQQIKIEDRMKIGYVHIGGIQILIKSTFQEGIDSPIKIALMDNRINDKYDAILGMVQGNLCYQKIIFTCYPKFAISLKDENLNKTLNLAYDLLRYDLMKQGSCLMTIQYIVGYALTNSHSSELFKEKEFIEIEPLFQNVGRIDRPDRTLELEFSDEWSMDLNEKPLYLEGEKPKMNMNDNQGIVTIRRNDLPRRSFSMMGSSSNPLRRSFSTRSEFSNPLRRSFSTRSEFEEVLPRFEKNEIIIPIIETKEKPLKVNLLNTTGSFKIKAEYYDGRNWHLIKMLIDTGAAGSYIHKDMVPYLEQLPLDKAHNYTNFNGILTQLNYSAKVPLRFNNREEVIIQLFVEQEMNANIALLLGTNFLNALLPYQISQDSLQINIAGRIVQIPRID